MLDPTVFRGWGRFQHMYHLCCFGWHDVQSCRPVASAAVKREVRARLFVQLAKSLGAMGTMAGCLLLLPKVCIRFGRSNHTSAGISK